MTVKDKENRIKEVIDTNGEMDKLIYDIADEPFAEDRRLQIRHLLDVSVKKVNDYWINGIDKSLEVVPARDKTMVFIMPLTAWKKIQEYSKLYLLKNFY